MPARRDLPPIAVAALYCALAVITARIVRADPGLALAGDSTAALAAALGAGALLVAFASTAHGDSGESVLFAAAALAWPLSEWNTPAAGAAFTVGLVLFAAWPPLLAAAALRALGRRDVGLVAAGAASTIGALGLLSALVFDPNAQGCARCPANHLLVSGDADASHRIGQIGLALSTAWACAFVLYGAGRLLRASAARRRVAAPVVVPAITAVAIFGADALGGVDRGFLSSDPTDRALHLAQAAAIALVAIGVAWRRISAQRSRRALARVVVDLGVAPSPGGLRDRLAAQLGDPSLQLLYARDGAWIDAAGHATTPDRGPDRELTRLTLAGEDVCAVVHRPGLLDDPALKGELVAATRLALEHERLHALRRADLAELGRSRARIVTVADAERRRLERDLHDGAQQRLVALAVGVRLARRKIAATHPVVERELGTIERELGIAVDELREVAQGLFPAVLGEEGLGAALEVLSEHDGRLRTGELTTRRYAATIESAAYFVVAQALRLGPSAIIAVDARDTAEYLVIDLHATPPIGPIPARVDDRAAAAGGTLTATGDHVRAEFPCVS